MKFLILPQYVFIEKGNNSLFVYGRIGGCLGPAKEASGSRIIYSGTND